MISSSESEKLLSVKNLNLVFNLNFYKSHSLRDNFVNFLKQPISFSKNKSDKFHVLKDINFDIIKGDRIGIVGVNGAGKSSLCRCLCGIYKPQTGSIDTIFQPRGIFNTNIGIVPELTGRENAKLLVSFLFGNYGHEERKLITEEAIKFADINEFIDIPFRLYSKGMQTRLYLSVVSSRPSEILILDEVFEGADANFSAKVSKRIKKLIDQSSAIIFVSHIEHQLKELCNRIIIIDKNSILFDGEIEAGLSLYSELIKNKHHG